ncbi:uncharacterized protein LOC122252037 [Penaeus japonicus]|uniref:uncharacterized protein LOC122252037 n=1 Tax=Penaeus japonicus TaxID=27405 RepID=UPI001C715696|nr:uncharacterized protein LOC122252037 [Penaeus japonicus]
MFEIYDRPTLREYRRTEKDYYRAKKLECDLEFLKTCRKYDTIPSFIKFKIYSRNFLSSHTYKSWLFQLLEFEIKTQAKKLSRLSFNHSNNVKSLKSKLSYIDFQCLSCMWEANTEKRLPNIRNRHYKKLLNLGIDVTQKVKPENVIFNLSNRKLTKEESDLLALGLDFGFPTMNLNYEKFFLGFECICHRIAKFDVFGNDSLHSIRNRISAIAKNAYRQFCHERGSNSETNDHQLKLLKKLREDNDLIITKPDKGRGIVLLNRTEYDSKVKAILDDRTKFKLLKTNIASHILKLEDKLNRFLRTFNYNLAKFLVPLLTPLTKNDYTVENTTDFVNEITTVKINGPVVMASVDVQSLFTNVPLEETTNLIVRKLVKSKDFQQLNEKQLTKALQLATADSVFTFNDDLYSQTDGVAMGSPLGLDSVSTPTCTSTPSPSTSLPSTYIARRPDKGHVEMWK